MHRHHCQRGVVVTYHVPVWGEPTCVALISELGGSGTDFVVKVGSEIETAFLSRN